MQETMDAGHLLDLNLGFKRKIDEAGPRPTAGEQQHCRPCKYLKIDVKKPSCKQSTLYRLPSDSTMVVQDALNFERSGLPSRFMYYDKGEWKDYPKDVIAVISVCFMAHKPSVKFSINGTVYTVNFLYMMQLNMHTGFVRSVAWIDDHGKCFSPSRCIEGYGDKLLSPLHFNSSKWNTSQENTSFHGVSNSHQERILEEESADVDFAGLKDRLTKVSENDQDFEFVKQKFLSGISSLASYTTVTGIYRNTYSSTTCQARLHAFKAQEEVTAESRGDANVRYGWHGTSKQGVSGIILHGFGQPRVPKNGATYGVGVYLAPEEYPHISAMYSDVDENGEHYMMLCKVIMGRSEKVSPGSKQFHPSSEDYDTGVDDLANPKRYIIWSTHMNTHILPQFVISFKLAPRLRAFIEASLKRNQVLREVKSPVSKLSPNEDIPDNEVESPAKQAKSFFPKQASPQTQASQSPRSPWISFSDLFSMIQSKLGSSDMLLLRQQYADFQAGKISRPEFVRKIRTTTGDCILRECLERKSSPVL